MSFLHVMDLSWVGEHYKLGLVMMKHYFKL
jgi:hypothetical protein